MMRTTGLISAGNHHRQLAAKVRFRLVAPIAIKADKLDADDLNLLCRLIELLDKWDRDAKITNKYRNQKCSQETAEEEKHNGQRNRRRSSTGQGSKKH